jgi:hypothetical protein
VRLGHSGLGGYDEYIEAVLERIVGAIDRS